MHEKTGWRRRDDTPGVLRLQSEFALPAVRSWTARLRRRRHALQRRQSTADVRRAELPRVDVRGGGDGSIEEDIGDTAAAAAAGRSGIPLRVVTVADGGAVVAFGVTTGEVPNINRAREG